MANASCKTKKLFWILFILDIRKVYVIFFASIFSVFILLFFCLFLLSFPLALFWSSSDTDIHIAQRCRRP